VSDRVAREMARIEEYERHAGDETPVTITLSTNVAYHLLCFLTAPYRAHDGDAGTWITEAAPAALRSALGLDLSAAHPADDPNTEET
jgi:hypothetical protein